MTRVIYVRGTCSKWVHILALFVCIPCAVLVLGCASSHRNLDPHVGCKPFRCLFDRDCKDGVCKSGLCASGTEIRELPINKDSLSLGASTIRTTEVTEGLTGTYKVEAMKGDSPVASLEWSYSIIGEVEEWSIRGTRIDQYGRIKEEKLIFDTNGKREGSCSGEFFFRFFDWLFRNEEVPSPLWLGGLGLTAGANKWALLHLDRCTPCDFPGCNCE